MATTLTYTALDAVTEALHEAGITPWGQTPEADDAEIARKKLRRMLKSWQATESFDWLQTSMSHTMTATAAQTLASPVRPVRIWSVRYSADGTSEMPMQELTRDEYDSLPNKAATGVPTCYHYDRQREAAVLYVWPVLASVAAETLKITYEREFPDFDLLSETMDVPGEAWDAVVFGLAARLARPDNYARLTEEAARTYGALLAGQNCGSVWFGEAY